MTEETTARDRAIEIEDPQDLAASTARICATLGVETEDDGWADEAVREIKRLRALAGAPTADVAAELDRAVRLRPAIEGRPEDGPYPASVGEVADEVADWIRDHEQHAAGLVEQVRARLAAAPEGVDAADELEERFVEANERMGEALVRIGVTLGLPRPSAQHHWGTQEILAKAAQLRTERDGWESVAAGLRQRDEAAQRAVEAVVRPGPAPELHRRQIVRLAEGWRPLARALAALCRTYDQTAPKEWR